MCFFVKNKNTIYSCAIIGLCFLYTSSGYLTWLHHLLETFSPDMANLLSEVVGYLFQALGLGLFCACTRLRPQLLSARNCFALACAVDLVLIVTACSVQTPLFLILFGFLMNLFHGIVAGFYLQMLTGQHLRKQNAAIFGFGYAFGTIGSWMLSLFQDRMDLSTGDLFVIYGFNILIIVLLNRQMQKESLSEVSFEAPANSLPEVNAQLLLLAMFCVLLLSCTNSIGFCLPLSVFEETHISLEFTRLFYVIGLILAGFINCRAPKYGGLACICALFFPFVELLLKGNSSLAIPLWCIGYVFFGFLAVYRVKLFIDIASKKDALFFFAPAGLLIGRIGDALGALLGTLLQTLTLTLCMVAAILFIATMVLSFVFFEKLYQPVPPSLETFFKQYDISSREQDVLHLIAESKTNKEIAELLYLSENTVKFHVKNILKKTECANRKELLAKMQL